jgi:type III pantothenate kinase
MLVAVDVGNSQAKAGLFSGPDLVRTARVPPGVPLRESLSIDPDAAILVVAVSVTEPGLDALREAAGAAVLVLGRDLPILVPNAYRDPSEVGRDRLAAAAAAHERADGPAVVVDAGSAVTVDAVAGDGTFLGGAIAPGLRAMVEGLARVAPALPAPGDEGPPAGLPRSTAEALAAGIGWGLAGLVDRLVAEAAAALEAAGEGSPAVLLTGGDADRIAPRLARAAVVAPHLTLHGVRILHERAVAAGEAPCT